MTTGRGRKINLFKQLFNAPRRSVCKEAFYFLLTIPLFYFF